MKMADEMNETAEKKCCREYSIWLMPKGMVYNRLSEIISKISQEYKVPNFQPHVTLIGEIKGDDLIAKTQLLASQIQSYTIKLKHPCILNEYFKSLFLKVEETEEVMRVNLKAQEIFNRKEKYFPHLSLMYSNCPTIEKLNIISSMEKASLEFQVDSLHLFFTKGRPENWHEIEKFPLSRNF